MPRVPPNFRRSDLQRAVRGLREAGVAVERVEIAKDGGFVLHTGKMEITTEADAAKQQWLRATEELTAKPPPEKPKPAKIAKGKHIARTSR
jgi:hypothetical protein